MKLGFWNRLAIVAGGCITLFGGTGFFLREQHKAVEYDEAYFQVCLKLHQDTDRYLVCDQERRKYPAFMPGRDEWLQSMAGAATLSALAYAIIWVTVFIGKWVWRGRKV